MFADLEQVILERITQVKEEEGFTTIQAAFRVEEEVAQILNVVLADIKRQQRESIVPVLVRAYFDEFPGQSTLSQVTGWVRERRHLPPGGQSSRPVLDAINKGIDAGWLARTSTRPPLFKRKPPVE